LWKFSKKGAGMRRKPLIFVCLCVISIMCSGCATLLLGVAAGGVGMYAASNDAIQGDSIISYEALWRAAREVSKSGNSSKEDSKAGVIELDADSSKVWIRVIRMSRGTTRLRVAARKYKLPNLTLAQDIFVKIMEEATAK